MAMMPKINQCEMTECSYNKDVKCHAMAITVDEHPACDTLFKNAAKGGAMNELGSVGACKASDCKFNRSFECTAQGINVGHHLSHADCMTYARR